MHTIYSDKHHRHHAARELIGGEFKSAYDTPSRAETILTAIQSADLGPIELPDEHGADPIRRVHTARYVNFLEGAWAQWVEKHGEIDAVPLIWPSRTLRDIEPRDIEGRVGYYCADAGTPITSGTWAAVSSASDVAVTAADNLLSKGEPVFALTRPPGHHAGAELYLGYCFINNAAIAAQRMLDKGTSRVAILDVDYHHGNGTQDIFYNRDDVLVASLHADPLDVFPFFSGHVDEIGTAQGQGFNVNLPLPLGTNWNNGYKSALIGALARIKAFAPDNLIVCLGVDTYEHDPIGKFQLSQDDYRRMGEAIADLGLSTLIAMEGGYMVEDVGTNVVSFLEGFS